MVRPKSKVGGILAKLIPMNEAQHIVPRLKRLIELEKALSGQKKHGASGDPLRTEINSIRDLLPTAILRHHDSRTLRGKKSLAPVTGGVCGACHLAIPSGRLADLRKIHNDLNVCDHCNVFIYLEEEGGSLPSLLKRVTGKGKKNASRSIVAAP
jgi:predicted  nucleic acid-binding Zn-ribbon protein